MVSSTVVEKGKNKHRDEKINLAARSQSSDGQAPIWKLCRGRKDSKKGAEFTSTTQYRSIEVSKYQRSPTAKRTSTPELKDRVAVDRSFHATVNGRQNFHSEEVANNLIGRPLPRSCLVWIRYLGD
jgi:hypothetical protein